MFWLLASSYDDVSRTGSHPRPHLICMVVRELDAVGDGVVDVWRVHLVAVHEPKIVVTLIGFAATEP